MIDEDPAAIAYAEEHGIPPVHRKMAKDAHELRGWLLAKAQAKDLQGPISERQVGYLNSLLSAIFGRDVGAVVARHQFLEFMFDVTSSKDLTKGQASALIDWAKPVLPQNGAHPTAAKEAWMVLREWGIQAGQLELGI